MRARVIVGSVCFLAGLGIGVIIPSLMRPAPVPAPVAPTAPRPVLAQARLDDAYFAPRRPEEPPSTNLLENARGEVQPPPRDTPPNWERPPWGDDREGAPPEIRTNREAMMAWMDQRRVERANALRTNFVAKAKLSDDEAVRFDVLMAALNMRVKEQSAKWREALDSGLLARSEVRARAMSEISSALVLTYDELDRNMPAGWRDQAGTDFNLMTFIDPEVWREIRPIMRGGFRGGGTNRPPDSTGREPSQR